LLSISCFTSENHPIAVKAAEAARPITAGSALQDWVRGEVPRQKDQCSGQEMGRPRVALESPLNAGIGLGIACLSDAPISEGNMGTNAKHFNGMAAARPNGMQPIFSCRSSGARSATGPLRSGYRLPPFERVSTITVDRESINRQRPSHTRRLDRDQGGRLVDALTCGYRRAEARLAKHGSEASTGADLPTP
jgi:hypothetical protein